MIVHAGERCLSCKVRGSEFTKSHDLMRHMLLYTEIFPVCRNIYILQHGCVFMLLEDTHGCSHWRLCL